MITKKTLIAFCLGFSMLIGNRSFAQQDPQYSHYMFNNFVLNPAVAGSKESLSILGLFRTQFVGLDGGPQTQTISAHMPIQSISSGVGLHIINDEIGFETNLNFAASYAYKYQFTNGSLSSGVSVGMIQRSLDGSKFKTSDPGNDPLVPKGNVSAITPDVALGVLYNTESFYIGLSATHLNRGRLAFDLPNTSEYRNQIHYYATGGYNWELGSVIDVKPSVLFKYTKSFQTDINTMVFYNQKFWGGVSYRLNDALIGLLGFNLTEKLKVSYSYDYTLSKLNLQSNGSHEILLGYDVILNKRIKNDIIIKTPRFL